MAGPWEKYAAQSPQAGAGPWTKYAQMSTPQQQGAAIQPVTQMTSPKLNIAASGENMPEYVGAMGAAAAIPGAAYLAGETPLLGPALKAAGRKLAPYALPAAGSYLINQARSLPVVGPIIKHIPFAEMLPWLLGGKGKEAAAEGAEAETPLTTPARTLPGMNPPEVTGRPTPGPIQGPGRGLMLPGETAPQTFPEISPSRVSTTPPSKSAQVAQAKAARAIPAVKDPSTIMPRLQAFAQKIQEEAKSAPASTELTPALQASLPQARVEGKVMQILRKEGAGLSIGKDRLMDAPELRGVDPDVLQKAVVHLRDQGKIWHEQTGGGAHPDSYSVALKKR